MPSSNYTALATACLLLMIALVVSYCAITLHSRARGPVSRARKDRADLRAPAAAPPRAIAGGRSDGKGGRSDRKGGRSDRKGGRPDRKGEHESAGATHAGRLRFGDNSEGDYLGGYPGAIDYLGAAGDGYPGAIDYPGTSGREDTGTSGREDTSTPPKGAFTSTSVSLARAYSLYAPDRAPLADQWLDLPPKTARSLSVPDHDVREGEYNDWARAHDRLPANT
jgi:hypothetical protein